MSVSPNSALLTDLYQLTMVQAYLEHELTDTAVFEFFVRKLPPERNFMVAAGLAQVVDYLAELEFRDDEITWLGRTGRFSSTLLDYLAKVRFDGDVDAMPEGTIFFPNEPILRITAPLPIAQLVESRVINLLHFQTLIASKAARVALAAPDVLLVDFGMRRAHGAEAGLLAARASYLAGLTGTATVLAGREYGIPIYGTMAHSFIQAHGDEIQAFEDFAESHPDNVVLLIDTYDTERGAERVVQLAPRLESRGIGIKAVRIDSGDLGEHAKKVRRILDAGGLEQVGIFASGNLDEYHVRELLTMGAPITGFGVGTNMDVSNDVPALDCAYKLQEYAGQPRRKRSEGKATWAGRKQVYRRRSTDGLIAGDTLTVEGDAQEGGALIQPVIRAGRLITPLPLLADSRRTVCTELARLPAALAALEPASEPYPVEVSSALRRITEQADSVTR